jgi:hypothetical protein
MKDAALEVMAGAVQMENDNCIVSAIHGLGHWATAEPRAAETLRRWLENPITSNIKVIEYAKQAAAGCIL